MTSRSSTSLPVVGSDSWVLPFYVGRGGILIHCGVPLARSARYPIRPQSDLSLLDTTNNHLLVMFSACCKQLNFVNINNKSGI